MRLRPTRHLGRFTTIIAIGLLFGTGCPKDEENPATDAGERDADAAPDTGSDAGTDTEADIGVDTDPDADTTAANCVVDAVSPRTFPIDEPTSDFEMTLTCDRALESAKVGSTVTGTWEHADDGSQELQVESVECVADGESQRCTLGLGGLKPPQNNSREGLGPGQLMVVVEQSNQLLAGLHWHLPADQVADLQSERDMLGLPPGFGERGLDFAVKQTEAGRLVAGVMTSEAGTDIEMFTVAPNGDVSVERSIALEAATLDESRFEMTRVGSGFGAFWWAFDEGAGEFIGGQTVYTATGVVSDTVELDRATYTGPMLTQVLGAEAGWAEVGGELRMSIRVLARTARGTVAVVRLSDAAGANRVALEDEFDVLGSTAAVELEAGLTGLIGSERSSDDLDVNRGVAWAADKNGNLQLVPLSGAGGSCNVSLTSVQYPYELDVQLASDRRVLVMSKSDGDDDKWEADVVEVERSGGGFLCGAVSHLRPLPGIDLAGTSGVIEASEPSTHTHLGRLSGTNTPVVVQWDSSAGTGDVPAPVRMVRPALAEERAAAIGAAEGDRVLTGINPDGSLQLIKTDALRSSCTDAAACAQPLTGHTRGGWRVNLVPGDTGPAWAVDKYGDILIDGVPLVFDLTQPPIIVDAPGASSQEDAAMILAGIDHETATHAVWTVSNQGEISEPGLLALDTGDPETGVVLTAAYGDDGDGGDKTLTVAMVIVELGADGSTRAAGTFTATAARLAGAIGAADPLDFATDGPEFDVSEASTQAVLLPPARSSTPDLAYQGGSDAAEVLAELTAEQDSRPLVLTYSDSGLFLRGDDGDPPLEVLLDDEPVANDNPIFVGGESVPQTTVAGDTSRQSGPHYRSFRRARYDYYRVGADSSSTSGGSGAEIAHRLSVARADFPGGVAGDGALILGAGDFNADGLEDVVIVGEGGGSTVVFGDGLDGFLPDAMPVPGGPTLVWPTGADAAVSGTTPHPRLDFVSQMNVQLL